jgi:hypothetical protein
MLSTEFEFLTRKPAAFYYDPRWPHPNYEVSVSSVYQISIPVERSDSAFNLKSWTMSEDDNHQLLMADHHAGASSHLQPLLPLQ